MPDLITQTAKLMPYVKRPRQVSSFVTAYVYEPEADDAGAALGNLYVVLEVLISGRASNEVADVIIDTIGDQYYNQPASDKSPLERFEAAIKTVNTALSELVKHGNASWLGKLSAVIAVQNEGELHVAQTGSAEAFLYRGKAASHINAGTATKPNTPSKTFGAIATGQLEPGDRILFATPALIHQVPLNRLQSIVSQSTPNSAIAELTKLLKGSAVDRIGVLIIAVTTPELAALEVRSEDPSEIKLGTPDNALEAAKLAAAPIAQTTVSSTKKIAKHVQNRLVDAKPVARSVGLAAAASARRLLSHKYGRYGAVGVLALVLILALFGTLGALSIGTPKQVTEFNAAFTTYSSAKSNLQNGRISQANASLAVASSDLGKLQPQMETLNSDLAKAKLEATEPNSLTGLANLIDQAKQEIAALTTTSTQTIASFSASYGTTSHFEIYNGRAYVFGSGQSNSLTIVNLSTHNTASSSADVSQLGTVTATALSYDHTGIFVLTDAPAVWFYRFSSDTISQLSNSSGSWPRSTAIASYMTNLYLLSNGDVYKYAKGPSAYGPASSYITASASSSTLAVDGAIYLADGSQLSRYMLGTITNQLPLPALANQVTNLRSFTSGSLIIGTDSTSHTVLEWSVSNGAPMLAKQLAVESTGALADASYDPSTNALYALNANNLVKLIPQS